MPYIYVGTPAQVAALQTRDLLLSHPWHAIWCPPPQWIPWHVQLAPTGGEPILLVWRPTPGGALTVLGCGEIVAAPAPAFGSPVLWTNGTAPGLRPLAQGLGYGGPLNMAFLRLSHVSPSPTLQSSTPLPPLQSGMNEVPAQSWQPGPLLPCGC